MPHRCSASQLACLAPRPLSVQGYNPRCTARDVVLAVAGALMQRSFRPGVDARALAAAIAEEPLDRHAFVVLHNIDGPGEPRQLSGEAVCLDTAAC